MTHEELKQFVLEMTERDRAFRDEFLVSFAAHDPKESKASYVKRVKSILRSASDRHGFIGWHASGEVSARVFPLLDAAEKHIRGRNYMSAIHLAAAIAEHMTEALQYADDSNGSLGDCVNYAFEILFNISKMPISEDVRHSLIDYCFTAFDKKIYEGWDWHFKLLRIASELIKNEDELQLLLARTKSAERSEFETERAESITYDVLLKVRGEKEAEAYLQQHLANPELRRKAIEKALSGKQYEQARIYALDGVEFNSKTKPGLISEWYDWLLRIAQAQEDRNEMIKYARLLFVDGFRGEKEYYDLLKDYIPAEKWASFVEELVKDVATRSLGYTKGRIAAIYVREGWFDRLFELIKNSPSLGELERYEPYLKEDYAVELALLYGEAVIRHVSENVGRPHYQTAARYLRRIKKLGAAEKANEIIEKLRADYPQRRALQEELDLV